MSGIILLNKPRSLSSNTAVNIVKRAVGAKKAGHLGTLDVEAEGLLPITLDSSTKLFDLFLHKDKEYLTTFFFGEERDSYDLEGNVTRRDDKIVTIDEIKKVLSHFVGKQLQLPPQFSAKKVNGKKAYELARSGKSINLQPKQIEIYDFQVVKQKGENLFQFKISCSSGTYVRALCRDLAAKLSTCAECYDIIRTRCGGFMLNDAFTLEEVKAGKFDIVKNESLFDYPQIHLKKEMEAKLLNGALIQTELKDGMYKVFGSEFLGFGSVIEGKLKLQMRLN